MSGTTIMNQEKKELKRNTPHDAWPKDGIQKWIVPKGGSISFRLGPDQPGVLGGALSDLQEDHVILKVSDKRTLFDGRYCAVSGFIFSYDDGDWYVLANKRGEGAPDFKHCWNVVCGFLEADETDREGISREVLEETGYRIDPKLWKFQGVETDPEVCNNGNVSLRFTAVLNPRDFETMFAELPEGGEKDEVESVMWIDIKRLDEFQWAFNHRDLIPKMFKKLTWWEKTKAIIDSWIP